MYRFAHSLRAYRLKDVAEAIWYHQEHVNDLMIDLFFTEREQRDDFVSGAKKRIKVPAQHELVKGSEAVIEYKPSFEYDTSAYPLRESEVQPVTENELDEISAQSPDGSLDFDRQVQDLSSFASSKTSKRSRSRSRSRSSDRLSKIEKDDQLFRWQTVEDPSKIGQPYRCHLIDRKFRPAENVSNYLAGSASFHQMLDGSNLSIPVPGIVVDFHEDTRVWEEDDQGVSRFKVLVKISFFDSQHDIHMKNELRARMKEGSSVFDDGSILTFVHVLDVEYFRRCLEVKAVFTRSEWRKFRRENNLGG